MENIVIVVKERLPYLVVKSKSKILPPVIDGAMFHMLKYISSSVNFNVTLNLSPDNQYGSPVKGGVWNGMIGILMNEKADIALTPTTMTAQRGRVIEFSQPVYTSEKTLLVGRPPNRVSAFAILTAFDSTVSYLVLAGFLTTLIIPLVINKIINSGSKFGSQQLRFWDHLWLLLEITLGKSSLKLPKRIWGRVLLWSWMFPVIVLTGLISSNLISSLSIIHSVDQIKTLEDLLKFPQIQPLFSEGSSEADYFKHIHFSPYSDIWKRAESMYGSFRDATELESEDVLTDVERNKYVIINDLSTFESNLATRYQKFKKCNFYLTKPYVSSYLAIMFRKNISRIFTESVNGRILLLQQYGVLDYLSKKSLQSLDVCLNYQETDSQTNSLEKLAGIFILGMVGATIAGVEFIGEILLRQLHHFPLILSEIRRKNIKLKNRVKKGLRKLTAFKNIYSFSIANKN